MVTVKLKFKDGEVIIVTLENHVHKMWTEDQKTKGALKKFGELIEDETVQ